MRPIHPYGMHKRPVFRKSIGLASRLAALVTNRRSGRGWGCGRTGAIWGSVRRTTSTTFSAIVLGAFALGVGCRCSRTLPPTSAPDVAPSVRLYLVSTGAGALEPCGCVKDMLGGVDHFAALVASESTSPPRPLVLGAGPMLFTDPVVAEKRKTQDEWKARALFDVLHGSGLAAWTPGANDFALGASWLATLPKSADVLVAANVEGFSAKPARIVEVGRERVGIAGV